MACSSCSQGEFVADRLDIWESAYQRLVQKEWGEDVEPVDVLHLAIFLAGDEQ
jgi:hypothetical protein